MHERAATSSAETSSTLASALGRRPAQAAVPVSPLVRATKEKSLLSPRERPPLPGLAMKTAVIDLTAPCRSSGRFVPGRLCWR
jgi:hypothetical protein